MVWLPSGNSITVQALYEDTVQAIKSKIEEVESSYRSHHQRLIKPGDCNDLVDGEVIRRSINNPHDYLVLKGLFETLS